MISIFENNALKFRVLRIKTSLYETKLAKKQNFYILAKKWLKVFKICHYICTSPNL